METFSLNLLVSSNFINLSKLPSPFSQLKETHPQLYKILKDKNIDTPESFLIEHQALFSDDSSDHYERKSEYLRAYYYLIVNESDSYIKDYIKKYSQPQN